MLFALVGPRWGRLLLALVLVLIARAAALVLPLSTRFLVDDVIMKHRGQLLLPLVLVIWAAALIQAGGALALTQILSKEGYRLVAELRQRVQQHVARLPTAFHDANKAGALASRIMSDVEGARHVLGQPLIEFVGGIFTAALALIYLFRLSITLTAAALLCIAIFIVISRQGIRKIRPVYRESAKVQAEVNGRLIESLAGIRVVKGYHAEQQEAAVFSAGAHKLLAAGLRNMKAASMMGVTNSVVLGTVSALMIYMAVLQITSGKLTVGGFVTFTAFVTLLMMPMQQLTGVGTVLVEAMAGLERTNDLLSLVPEDSDSRRTLKAGLLRGAVSFEHVTFGYDPSRPVLDDLSFEALPGSVTALVGSSGAGKSTIINLITAFYQPLSGSIRVDGQDLSRISLDTYRKQLGVVLQDTFLFDGTIRENVAFARPDASEEDIMGACAIAWVNQFAESFPQKYDTVVGERGVKLSGGQRQRISIARAILADPRILILDEATSSLDSESESAIQAGLAYLMEGRTSFVIAHRLSTIRRADKILVVEGGRIVEQGTHDSLYAARGRFYDLYTRQHTSSNDNLFLASVSSDAVRPVETPGRVAAHAGRSVQ
jgi:subfamily B ATP-binding cassette protein MsbA